MAVTRFFINAYGLPQKIGRVGWAIGSWGSIIAPSANSRPAFFPLGPCTCEQSQWGTIKLDELLGLLLGNPGAGVCRYMEGLLSAEFHDRLGVWKFYWRAYLLIENLGKSLAALLFFKDPCQIVFR